MINVFQPNLGLPELVNLEQVFLSNWLGAGKKVEEFTSKFAEFRNVNKDNLLTISSCTDGLFLSMQLCDVQKQEVVMPSIHFVGAANAVIAAGGTPIFCDVDPLTLNPTHDHIYEKITDKTAAVTLIHYGGRPCTYIGSIAEYTTMMGIYLIEDSACSLASSIYDKSCGTFGDIGLWSFDPMKLISCGDGGMMYVRSKQLLNMAKEISHFGLSSKSGLASSQTNQSRWWEFEVECAGRYSTMNDVDAAILLAQLNSLDEFIKHRQMVDNMYRSYLADIEEITLCPPIQDHAAHSHYFFWIQTERRDELAVYLKQNNIYTTFRYHPLHTVKFYNHRGSSLPGTRQAARTTLLLPMHASLSVSDVTYICEKIQEFYKWH